MRIRMSAKKELTVCDIMGEWGAYQWSLTLFAVFYSAICSMTVIVGPLWTPNMSFICAPSLNASSLNEVKINFSAEPHECYANADYSSTFFADFTGLKECTNFIYDQQKHGIMLTNTFDLVCSREWLKAAISSSVLVGMLLSSVSLGLLSDKYGRMSCIKTGCIISIVSTILAMFAHNYLLLNIFIMLMSYAQVGVANAMCTLVMEATSPKWRFVPVFEYGLGWGLGMFLAPFINELTMNYKHFLLLLLVWQLIMLLWFKWGIFESIRWLLSEGLINQAQIELRRACRFNRIKNGAQLAQKIAEVQMSQLRKASSVIEEKMAPLRLAKAMQQELETASQELTMLSSAIRSSFAIGVGDSNSNSNRANEFTFEQNTKGDLLAPRMSLCVSEERQQQQQLVEMMMLGGEGSENNIRNSMHRNSITTQGLIQLALKYSKTLQQQEEGRFFLLQMFHRKLYKITLVLMLLSVMLETSYYGLIQANKFVGTDIKLNYVTGAFSEWLAATLFMITLWVFTRRIALMLPTVLASIACLSIALTYQLIPNTNSAQNAALGLTGAGVQFKTLTFGWFDARTGDEMIAFRDNVNFYVMNLGKLCITTAIQVAATIVMEAYPNNLRQSGSGAIVMVGRIGSIMAPFLFNDRSEDKIMFKITLIVMSALGISSSALVPFLVRDSTGAELCDRLNEIED